MQNSDIQNTNTYIKKNASKKFSFSLLFDDQEYTFHRLIQIMDF